MSKRLQVLMSEADLERLRRAARREELSVGEWVRRVISERLKDGRTKTREDILRAIDKARGHSFPAPGIEQMNREIEEGYIR